MMQFFVFLVSLLLVHADSVTGDLSQKQMRQKRRWDSSPTEQPSSGSPTPQNSPARHSRRGSGQNPELAELAQSRVGKIDFAAINPALSGNGLTRRILIAKRTIKQEQQPARPSSADIRATALASLANALSITKSRTPSPVAFAPASHSNSASPVKPLATRTPIPSTPATPLVRDTPTTPMDDQ